MGPLSHLQYERLYPYIKKSMLKPLIPSQFSDSNSFKTCSALFTLDILVLRPVLITLLLTFGKMVNQGTEEEEVKKFMWKTLRRYYAEQYKGWPLYLATFCNMYFIDEHL